MSALELYLLLVFLPGVGAYGEGAAIVGGVFTFLCAMLIAFEEDIGDGHVIARARVGLRWGVVALVLGGALASFTPSRAALIEMGAGYIATNAQGARELPANLVGATNAWLKRAEKQASK